MAQIDSVINFTSDSRTGKLLRIKNIPLHLLFVLKRLGKSRRTSITSIVLETFREYSLRLKIVDNIGYEQRHGHEHTWSERLTRYFYFFYPYSSPKEGLDRDRFCCGFRLPSSQRSKG